MRIPAFIFSIMIFLLIGCAAGPTKTPYGRDWGNDEAYCLERAGRVTGFMASTPLGLAVNAGGADARYEKCLRELGWID